jgi:hypothetical protein
MQMVMTHSVNGLTLPSARFLSEIQPAWQEYLSDPLVERKANNLARAMDHHLDWTFSYYNQVDRSRLMGATSLDGFREKVFGLCPELQMMRDLSDAAHHRFLTRSSAVVVTSSAAYSFQNGALLVPDYGRSFGDSARKAVEFWRQWPD